MKKVPVEVERRFSPVELYIDDVQAIIDEIIKLPNDDGRRGSYKVYLDQYELEISDSLTDLDIKETNIFRITYSSFSPYGHFTVYINKSYCLISNNFDDPVFHGVFRKIETILLKKKRKTYALHYLSTIGIILLVLGIMSLAIYFVTKSSIYFWPGAILCWISTFANLLKIFTNRYQISVIKLFKKIDDQSFFRKNRDKLIILIFSNILTLICGVVSVLIIQAIGKK